MNNKNFPTPSRNIFWRDITNEKDVEIELKNNVYIYYRGGMPDSVVYWMGEDANEAQRWLNRHSFCRCASPSCGIRVPRQGDNCGNHCHEFTADALKQLPTIKEGHFDNLKMEKNGVQYWLSRMTVADGAPYDNQVTVMFRQNGKWKTGKKYQAK